MVIDRLTFLFRGFWFRDLAIEPSIIRHQSNCSAVNEDDASRMKTMKAMRATKSYVSPYHQNFEFEE